MGRKKSLLSEGIQEAKDIGNEGVEKGEELSMDSAEVRALLDSIDTDMDDDDVQMIESTKEEYRGSFSEAFSGEVLEKQSDMERIGEEQLDIANEEIDKVSKASDTYSSMERVSEVGSEHAERASDAMDSSRTEYEEMIEDVESSMEDIGNHIAEVEKEIDSIFS